MPYPQDLVGKYINYKIDQGGTGNMSAHLVNGVLPGQTTAATVAVYTGVPPVGQGKYQVVNTNVPWTFTFLKYYAGFVTTAPLTGPVMTGPMSGCYLCKYTRGGQKLAHIGTAHNPQDPASIAAKKAWLTFVARGDVSGVKGGSPADYFPFGEIKAAMRVGDPVPQVVGYFAAGAAYAILLAAVRTSQNPAGLNLLKVAAVKTMTMQPWSSIAAMRRFKL